MMAESEVHEVDLKATRCRERVDGNTVRIDKLEANVSTIFKMLNYRLPIWATFFIAAQSAAIAWFAKGA